MPIKSKTPAVTRGSSEVLSAINTDDLPEIPLPELQRWWFDVRRNLLQEVSEITSGSVDTTESSATPNTGGSFSLTSHDHDTLYYRESEVDSLLSGKSDVGHNHDTLYYRESELDAGQLDNRYYTETEINTLLTFASGLIVTNTDPATDSVTGAVQIDGGISVDKASWFGGSVVFNGSAGINNFTINKQTSGEAYKYDASLDTLTWGSPSYFPASTTTRATWNLAKGAGPSTPSAGDFWFQENHLTFCPVADTRVVIFGNETITSDTTVANTVTETTVYTAVISADEFHVGQMINCEILGRFSTANASDSFTARLKIGGTTIDSIGSVSKNVTDVGFDITFIFTVRSIGASGTIKTHTTAIFDDLIITDVATGTETIDTTTNNNITLTIEWDSADAGNTVTISQGRVSFIG